VLVVLGSLLGTAIMTGSFVVGDTFTSSIRRGAYDQLGPVDEVVSGAGLAQGAALRERLANFTNADVDGVLALTSANAAVATVTEPRRAAPDARLLETDFDTARAFGGDSHATGIAGDTPEPGESAIGADLAHELRVGVGDRIEVFAYGTSKQLEVSRVLPRRGVAGFWRGDEKTSHNAFVAPGTIAALIADGNGDLGAPPQAMVLVSNVGGVIAGADATAAVSRALTEQLGSLPYTLNAAKASLLERADRSGSSLSQIYSSLGTFGVLAGILLLVNIFFMLADERKSELGMLRAVGLRRASLVGAFATEGWCYALASSIAGTFVGLGLGRAMMAFAARLRASGADEGRLQLRFAFTWASVQRGLVIGFVIAIASILLTSIWLSRFNIIRAIRDISETPPHRPRARAYIGGAVLAAFGGLLTVLGVLGIAFVGLVIGPVFVFAGVGPMLARHFPRAHVTTALATAVLLWGLVAVPIALALQSDVNVFMFVAQGLMLVGAAVVLISQQQRAIGQAVGRVAQRSLDVRLGLAYPLARRFRTAMTLGMFALVVFILVYVSVIGAMFSGQLNQFTREASGGFNAITSSNPSDPVPVAELEAFPGVRAVAPLDAMDLLITRAPGLEQPRPWDGTGFDASFVGSRPPALDDRGEYPTDRAAYEALLADPNLAIIDEFFLAGGAGPPSQALDIGDQFTVRDLGGGGERTFTVAAIADNDFAENGVLMSRTAAREAFGDRGAPSRAYVDAVDPEAFADNFGARFLDHGGRAETIRGKVHDELSSQNEFFVLIRGYLALGLIVGIAGIGVIMVRAVRERRRQVGVLRALGVQAAAVRRAFVVESAFVAAEGLVIGTALALVTAWSITLTDAFGAGMGFRVPVVGIAGVVIGTLVCALLATAAPARAAARIRPAVALRITD
jgi:putative ABC transport system permease protein